jgi:hypothetical protein
MSVLMYTEKFACMFLGTSVCMHVFLGLYSVALMWYQSHARAISISCKTCEGSASVV